VKVKLRGVKGFIVGFISSALLTSGIAYAADAVKLDAYFGVKLIQNGIDKTPEDKKPFIVDGTTYVPLRAVSELLGADITWDGANNAVVLGQKVEGEPLPAPSGVEKDVKDKFIQNDKFVINGKQYGTGTKIYTEYPVVTFRRQEKTTIKYDLNAQYSTLTLGIGMDDQDFSDATRTVSFKDQDGKVLKQVVLGKGAIHEAVKIDVKGVLQLNLEISNIDSGRGYIDLINPVLSK
jgi:hypothetical protein